MNWYLAKLVFRIFCGHGNHTPQFNEQLRMICAEDELHAFYKARLLGEGDRFNDRGDNLADVTWTFIDVSELHHITRFTDGAEIFSVIIEEPGADLYIRSIQQSAKQLLQQALHQFSGLNRVAIDT